jgi:hypothetical protein
MDNSIGSYIAGGGVSGAIIAAAFLLYKLCAHRRFRSSCCGASVDMRDDNGQPSPTNEKKVELPTIRTSD